ncbi:retrovirus-related pol polyprotein from transposon TNT 1-94 [Tanacetum coccineum]
MLFQPMFDEYFEQSRVNEPVPSATAVNAQVVPPGTSLSTTIAQDAPSTSASSSTSDMHHPVRHQGIAEEPTLEDSPITHDALHPSFNPVTGEPGSTQSSSGNVNSAEPNQAKASPRATLSIENRSLFEGESEFEKLKIYLITLVSIRSDWEDLPWLFRSVEYLNSMEDQNVPAQAPTRTNEQIVPRSQWLQIGKSNLLFDAQKIQKNPIFQISVDILRNTNFFRAFSASASVPAIYIQQFWNSMKYDEKTGVYCCQVDEQWFNLSADLFRKALDITPVNPAHPFELPLTGDTVIDFVNQLGYPEPVEFVSNIRVNYVYQPWRAILTLINQCLTGKTSGGDKPRHPVLQMLWGIVTQTNVDHAELLWEEFTQGIQTFFSHKASHKASLKDPKKKAVPLLIPYGRFTKMIIYYLGSTSDVHKRPESPCHLPGDDFLLGNLKFISKGETDEVFGMAIPKQLITQAIQQSSYYPKYLEMVAKNTKKTPQDSASKQPEPATKRAPPKKPTTTTPVKPTKPPSSKQPKSPTKKPSKRKLPQKVRKGKPSFQLVDEDDEAQQESVPQGEAASVLYDEKKGGSLDVMEELRRVEIEIRYAFWVNHHNGFHGVNELGREDVVKFSNNIEGCGAKRSYLDVEGINWVMSRSWHYRKEGKKYILVIVDDYSRFTWVKFLRSKDETPEFVINFLKQIQVGLNKTVRYIRTDNGTEFVNQVMSKYYKGVGIFYQKSVLRTPQQNGVVEIQNRTLVEATRTMLIFSKASMFLWAEAVATACYTQNRSLIHTHHNKTPYELVHDKKPDLTFLRVFGALCYPTNDREDLGKFQAKADIGIFVGYAPSRKGYRIYNKRTRLLMETIHVTFDEMYQTMDHVLMSSGPEPIIMTPGQLKSGLAPTDKELKMLFQPMFDEYLEQSRVNEPVPFAIAVNTQVVPPGTSLSITIAQDAPSTSASSSTSEMHHPVRHQGIAEEPTLEDSPIIHDALHPSFNPVTREPGLTQSSSGNVNSAEPN